MPAPTRAPLPPRRTPRLAGTAAVAAVALALAGAPAARADTSDARVAFVAGHVDDAWRRASLEAWGEVAERAARDGVVAAADAFASESDDPAGQAARIDALVGDGYDAIVVNAAPAADALSRATLEAAVGRACDAGTVVVSFAGLVAVPCAWRVSVDHRRMGREQVNRLAERFPDGGNLLQVRGPEGDLVDERIDAGVSAAVEVRDGLDVVASVRAAPTREAAREAVAAVLPGLPPVIGVLAHGADGIGIADAFEAAEREVPPIALGNRHAELAWWAERADETGYETWSAAMAPGVSTLAFWVARRLLEGVPVPRDLTVGYLAVDAEGLDAALRETERDGVLDRLYSAADADRIVAEAD